MLFFLSCHQFSAALNMMNSAADGGPPPSSWTAPPQPQPAAAAPAAAPPGAHFDASDLTLRQVGRLPAGWVGRAGNDAAAAIAPPILCSLWLCQRCQRAATHAPAPQFCPSRRCTNSTLGHLDTKGMRHTTDPQCLFHSPLQLVEQFAEEAGITFLPKPGRTHEGLQVRRRRHAVAALASSPPAVAAPLHLQLLLVWHAQQRRGVLAGRVHRRCLTAARRCPPTCPSSLLCKPLLPRRSPTHHPRWHSLSDPSAPPQVYGFGLVSCVVDNSQSVVRAQLGDAGWTTVSLEQLLGEHERRAAARAQRK